MASTHKSLRSSTADKRPTTSIADGQIALNTNAASPGLFFKDSAGTDIIKVGPVHVGTTAPNATPATGGSSGNSTGEVWLDTSLTPVGVKIWNGSSWENATPAGSTTVQGLLELATNAETQTGTDTARAVTPAGLQSKVSDSTSTTSSTTIASSTAVKAAYDLANAALPKTGGTITGALEIGTTGSLVFEGATANDFETTVAVTDPTADRTITLPDRSGTVITNADTGTVTSTMIADGTIVDADVNASAAIAGTKISPNFGAQTLVVDTNVLYVDATTDRVGIGTSSATFPLQVETTATGTTAGSNGVMLVQSQASGRDAHIRFGDSVNSTARVGYLNNNLYAYVNGQERLRIDSSGRLGLGTSIPSSFNAVADDLVVSSTGHTGITINAGTADSSNIFFADSNSNSQGQIRYFHSTDSLSFGVNSSDAIRILSSGNVGIGNTSPDDYLTIANTSTSGDIGLRFKGDASSRQFIMFGDPGGTQVGDIMYDHGTNAMRFRTNNNERVRIDSSGVLTAGNSTATGGQTIIDGWYNGDNRLNVLGSQHSSGGTVLAFAARPKGGGAGYVSSVGIAAFARSAIELDGDGFKFKTGSSSTTAIGTDVTLTEVVRIANGGNVGIGASAPAAKLDVAGNQIFTAANPQIQFNAGGPIIRLPSANTLAFLSDSSTERVRIDSSGRLKVGTTADIIWNQTSVDGVVIEQTGATQIVRNGDVPLLVTRNTSTGQIVKFSQAGTERGSILYDGDFGISSEGNLTFDTSGTEKVRIDSSGLVGMGTSSPSSYNSAFRNLVVANTSGFCGITVASATNSEGTLAFADGTTGSQTYRGYFQYNHTGDYLRIGVNGGEVARFDSSGNVGIGNSTPGYRLDVSSENTTASLGYAMRLRYNSTANAAAIQFTDSAATQQKGYIASAGSNLNLVASGQMTFATNGTVPDVTIDTSGYVFINSMAVGGTANVHWSSSNGQLFVTSSSERFKHGITAYDKGLTDLMQLEPKYFTYNDEPGQKQRAGFIAEDFHALGLTEYVEYWNDEDGNATVPSEIGYSNMVAILVKSIQEQQAMIETLQARVAALEGN